MGSVDLWVLSQQLAAGESGDEVPGWYEPCQGSDIRQGKIHLAIYSHAIPSLSRSRWVFASYTAVPLISGVTPAARALAQVR